MPARTSSQALRADLREFSSSLAARLPGSWNAVVVEDFHDHPLRKDVLGQLWDDGHVAWAVGPGRGRGSLISPKGSQPPPVPVPVRSWP